MFGEQFALIAEIIHNFSLSDTGAMPLYFPRKFENSYKTVTKICSEGELGGRCAVCTGSTSSPPSQKGTVWKSLIIASCPS